jgi:MFS family permease
MNARIQKHTELTTEPPSGEMQIGGCALDGTVGSFLANVASQLMGTHLGVQTGMRLSSTDVSCISAAYTMASFVGMVVAKPLEKALGMRRYFVASALLFSAFGWLQATRPSLSVLIAMRVFEGFITGGFGQELYWPHSCSTEERGSRSHWRFQHSSCWCRAPSD